MRKVVTTIFIFCLFQPLLTMAQNTDVIVVEAIEPRDNGGNLAISARFKNLFSKKIVGTIQSGLPSIVQIEIKLNDANKRTVLRENLSRTITYNIWEEVYTLQNPDTTLSFAEFEAIKSSTSRLDSISLWAKSELDAQQKYQFQVRVSIVPITSSQAEKVTDWLQDPNQTEEYIASENRTSGFTLNLNKLVSFFVSPRQKSIFTSEWFESAVFSIHELRK